MMVRNKERMWLGYAGGVGSRFVGRMGSALVGVGVGEEGGGVGGEEGFEEEGCGYLVDDVGAAEAVGAA